MNPLNFAIASIVDVNTGHGLDHRHSLSYQVESSGQQREKNANQDEVYDAPENQVKKTFIHWFNQ